MNNIAWLEYQEKKDRLNIVMVESKASIALTLYAAVSRVKGYQRGILTYRMEKRKLHKALVEACSYIPFDTMERLMGKKCDTPCGEKLCQECFAEFFIKETS